MEALTRLVSESLARHGFDRPLDYRRLQWSRWFRCESTHSLLLVPSKPGVFALAEEVVDVPMIREGMDWEGHDFSRAGKPQKDVAALAAEGPAIVDGNDRVAAVRRMLAVSQFFETDDMAFVLDRMLSHHNPMRARLASGRYFVRYVVIEDQSQRRSICSALNQWIVSSTEKATGIGSHFATSLELTPQTEQTQGIVECNESVARTLLSATADTTNAHVGTAASAVPRTLSEAKESSASLASVKEISTLSSERGTVGLAANQAGPDTACPEQNKIIRPAELTEPPFVIKPAPAAPAIPVRCGAVTNIHCPFPSGF
jgi:hypothetical protein